MILFKETGTKILPQQSGELQDLISMIIGLVQPSAIFLLGTNRTSSQSTSIFMEGSASMSHTAHCFFLVLLEKESPRQEALPSVQDTLENNLQHLIPSTALVVNTTTFLSWLTKGFPFAVRVLQRANRLFVSPDLLLPSVSMVQEITCIKALKSLFRHTKEKVDELLAGAELYCLRKQHALAAFLLHQAAEQALRMMVILATGYRPTTHSLDKLLRYASMVCPPLLTLFPKQHEKEKRLFSLLSRAYIDARYREDYSITGEELQLLTTKVRRLQALFEQVCMCTLESRTPADPQKTTTQV